jgi:hypothetical protein
MSDVLQHAPLVPEGEVLSWRGRSAIASTIGQISSRSIFHIGPSMMNDIPVGSGCITGSFMFILERGQDHVRGSLAARLQNTEDEKTPAANAA